MRMHLIPNSHIDPVWLWDKYEGIDEVLNTFRANCDRLDEFPDLTFTASSLQFYQWVRDHDAKLFDRIVKHVAAGRWEVVGDWWVEADSNLPTGESLRMQAQIAQAFARRYFGRTSEVAYLPDSFGHPATLPTLLAECGFRYFLFCRPGGRENSRLPGNLFHWEHEGKRILAYRLKHHYFQWGSPERRREMLDDPEYRQNPVNAFLFGVGNHGGGPSIEEIRAHQDFIRTRPEGDAGFSSCLAFFRNAEAATPHIPVHRGDLHMHAVGCYSVMRPLKESIRHAEHGLGFARRALQLAAQADDALTPLWKATLFNQFHDILPGSCAPHAAAACLSEMGGVDHAWREQSYAALKGLSIAHPVKTPEGEFRVFNTLPYPITVPIGVESCMYYREGAAFRDGDGREIDIQEVLPSVRCGNRRWEFVDTLPASGFKCYAFDSSVRVDRPGNQAAHYRPGETIATRHARIEPDGTTAIANANGSVGWTPLLNAPPRLLVLRDTSDTWGHGQRAYDDVEGAFSLDATAVATGPVTAKLFQSWSWGHSRVEAIWSIYEELPQVDIDLRVHWSEDRRILKLELCPWRCRTVDVTMQAPGGSCVRPADGAEQPLHHWLSLPGVLPLAVLQDGAFACDVETGRLRLTLVRSSYYGYDENQPLGPCDPQQRTDQGTHAFRLSLRWGVEACASPEALDRAAAALLEPCWTIRESANANAEQNA